VLLLGDSLSSSTHPTLRFDPLLRCIAQSKGRADSLELLVARAELRAAAAPEHFERLRDLATLPRWWPEARAIQALPPGIFGVGDAALIELHAGEAWCRVMAYQQRRRLVLAIVAEREVLTIDWRLLAGDRLELRIEAPARPTPWAAWSQSLRLARLCRRAIRAIADARQTAELCSGADKNYADDESLFSRLRTTDRRTRSEDR
jgi:hypothetical protein